MKTFIKWLDKPDPTPTFEKTSNPTLHAKTESGANTWEKAGPAPLEPYPFSTWYNWIKTPIIVYDCLKKAKHSNVILYIRFVIYRKQNSMIADSTLIRTRIRICNSCDPPCEWIGLNGWCGAWRVTSLPLDGSASAAQHARTLVLQEGFHLQSMNMVRSAEQ